MFTVVPCPPFFNEKIMLENQSQFNFHEKAGTSHYTLAYLTINVYKRKGETNTKGSIQLLSKALNNNII